MDKIVKATKLNEGVSEAALTAASQPRYLNDRPRHKTMPLSEPLEVDGVEYHEITAHRLTGRDLLALQQGLQAPGADPGSIMFSAMCHVPPHVILALDAVDFAMVANVAKDFMPQSVLAASASTGSLGLDTPQT